MNRIKKFSYIFLSVLVLSMSGTAYADKYATTDMTWAEFYAGETGQTSKALEDAGLDAVSSATNHTLSLFPLSAATSNDAGSTISGVKDVQVVMTDEVYEALKNTRVGRNGTGIDRFTFVESAFTDLYKIASSDGSFGAMVKTSTPKTYDATKNEAAVTINSGSASTWGSYTLSIKSADIPFGTLATDGHHGIARNLLGATLETSDNTVYGLRPNSNTFSEATIALTVNDAYIEPHGVIRDYDYTADLPGKTISKITYMLKDSPDVVISGLEVLIPKVASVKAVTPDGGFTSKENLEVTMKFDIPDGLSVNYDSVELFYSTGRGRNAVKTVLSKDVDYSYDASTKVLKFIKAPSTGTSYTVEFSDSNNSGAVKIKTTIKIQDAHYAVTDMTYAEFYAGELGDTANNLKNAGLDAVSSATKSKASLFATVSADSDGTIYGLKAVQVRISDDVYKTLTDTSRYTFISSGASAFTEYKPVLADGSFGKMITASKDAKDAVVTATSGASSTWGTYTLNISNADVEVGSSREYYLGAVIEAKLADGTTKSYGLRHNNNLWVNPSDMAITINGNFIEPHGMIRPYEYTKELGGATVTKITYMLKNLPDVVVNCNVLLKKWPEVTATPNEPKGGWLIGGSDLSFDITFDGTPAYSNLINVYSGSGRNRRYITESCDFANGILTISGSALVDKNYQPVTGTYTAVFSHDEYVDFPVSFDLYTTSATNLIMPDENNLAGNAFMLSPKGALSSTDKVLDELKLINASECTVSSDNYSALYTSSESNQIKNSGFSFDIILKDVPGGKTGIVGFSYGATINAENFSGYANALTALEKLDYAEEGGYRYYLVDKDGFASMNIAVKDGINNKDITDKITCGAMISGNSYAC